MRETQPSGLRWGQFLKRIPAPELWGLARWHCLQPDHAPYPSVPSRGCPQGPLPTGQPACHFHQSLVPGRKSSEGEGLRPPESCTACPAWNPGGFLCASGISLPYWEPPPQCPLPLHRLHAISKVGCVDAPLPRMKSGTGSAILHVPENRGCVPNSQNQLPTRLPEN